MVKSDGARLVLFYQQAGQNTFRRWIVRLPKIGDRRKHAPFWRPCPRFTNDRGERPDLARACGARPVGGEFAVAMPPSPEAPGPFRHRILWPRSAPLENRFS